MLGSLKASHISPEILRSSHSKVISTMQCMEENGKVVTRSWTWGFAFFLSGRKQIVTFEKQREE